MPSHQSGPGATQGQEMEAMMRQAHMVMMQPAVWTPGYAVVMFVMWWVMMMAMMLPSASPTMISLLLASAARKRPKADRLYPPGIFAAGYLVAWGVFSLIAIGFQWGLEYVGLLSAMMGSTSALFGGLVLIVAGIYQCTPLKHACAQALSQPVPIRDTSLAHGDARGFADGY